MWQDLSFADRNKVLKLGVDNGITSPSLIKHLYNINADGGYLRWKKEIAKYKHLDIDNDKTYNYQAFFEEDPQRAWDMLKKDSKAHFTDKFKTVWHPTFSDESMYSGQKSEYNPQGLVGGHWDGNTFKMSDSLYKSPVSMDERQQYLINNESNGASLLESDGSLPVYDGIPWGGVLPEVTVSPQYAKGGSIHIAKNKRGTFKAQASRMGMSTQQAASHILANKDNYSPAMVKKAVFAHNFAHADGGALSEEVNDVLTPIIQYYEDNTPTFVNQQPNVFKGGGQMSKARKAVEYFVGKGLSREQAAGLVGNLMRESGLDPTAINPNSGAYGLAQWLGDRKKRLFRRYGSHPTYENQLDYIWDELNSTHKKGLQMLQASESVEDAARNAFGYYEFSAGPDAAVAAMNRAGKHTKWKNPNGTYALNSGIKNANLVYGETPVTFDSLDDPNANILTTPQNAEEQYAQLDALSEPTTPTEPSNDPVLTTPLDDLPQNLGLEENEEEPSYSSFGLKNLKSNLAMLGMEDTLNPFAQGYQLQSPEAIYADMPTFARGGRLFAEGGADDEPDDTVPDNTTDDVPKKFPQIYQNSDGTFNDGRGNPVEFIGYWDDGRMKFRNTATGALGWSYDPQEAATIIGHKYTPQELAQLKVQRHTLEDEIRDNQTVSTDNTWVQNDELHGLGLDREQNPELDYHGITGALNLHQFEKDHPIQAGLMYATSALPFAVAAYPFLAGAGELAFPLTEAAVSSSWFPYANALFDSAFAAHGLNDIFHGNANAATALEILPLMKVGPAMKLAYNAYMEGNIPQWLRNTAFWHDTTALHRANRAADTSQGLEDYWKGLFRQERKLAQNNPKALDNSVTISERTSRSNPIQIEKMKPEEVRKTWDRLHPQGKYSWQKKENPVTIEDINGRPTAVVHLGGYDPKGVVTTGDFAIPDFQTGTLVTGRLDIQGGVSGKKVTQFGEEIAGSGEPRTVTGMTPLQDVLQDNYRYVQQELPGFQGFGSSIGVMDGSLSHITHDIDGFMTREAFDAARKVHPDIQFYNGNETAAYFIKPETYGRSMDGANKIDINVIDVDQSTGLGNQRATELFRQFFPREYRQSVINTATRTNDTSRVPIVHLDGTPFTNQELLDAYDPLTKTIMDSMESSKPKHVGRMMEYLAGPHPEKVHEAIQKTFDEMAQTHTGVTLPKIKFGTPEENAAALQEIGFTGDIGTISQDPEKMQNVFDMWYMGESGMFSRSANAGDMGETGGTVQKLFRNFTDWNAGDAGSGSGGHGAGAYLNTVYGNAQSVIGRSVYGVITPKMVGLREGMTPQEVISTLRQQAGWSDELVTPENLDKIVQALRDNGLKQAADAVEHRANSYMIGKKHITFNELLSEIPSSGEKVKAAGRQIHATTGINAIGGSEYGSDANYAGFIGDVDPESEIGFFARDEFQGPIILTGGAYVYQNRKRREEKNWWSENTEEGRRFQAQWEAMPEDASEQVIDSLDEAEQRAYRQWRYTHRRELEKKEK